MVQILGFNVHSFSLLIPDGISDISDISSCELRVSLTRHVADKAMDVSCENIVLNDVVLSESEASLSLNECNNELVPAAPIVDDNVNETGLDMGVDTIVDDMDSVNDKDDRGWRSKSVYLPEGTLLRIALKSGEVRARAIIQDKKILILESTQDISSIGKSFASSSAAAVAVSWHKSMNGWDHWQVLQKNEDGEPVYVLLGSLRSENEVHRRPSNVGVIKPIALEF